ncbi:MAG: FHA domain-containing protein, partial [Myxococcales bacterium]
MAAIVQQQPVRKRYSLGERTDVGRSPECDVVIADASISRRHATIAFRDGAYVIFDLQSKFGTYVNDKPVKEATLQHGDRVRLGHIVLDFENLAAPETPSRGAAAPAVHGAHGKALAGLGKELAAGRVTPQRLQQIQSTIEELERRIGELSRAERKNEVLLEVGKLINFNFQAGMLLECIIDAVMRAMRAERCAILLPEAGMLVPRAARQLPTGIPEDRFTLVGDAYSRNQLGEGVPFSDGRRSYCVPMRGNKDQLLGLIYLDLPVGRALQRDETELFVALTQQVALALDNVMLLESVRAEEKKRESLSRYLSDGVVDMVVSGRMDLNLGGEYREASVMFVDVRGFTSLSEKLQPAEVLEMLNEYFTATTEAVFEVQGTVDKYIGDALMAVFGAPVHFPDHAERAVRAAMEIRKKVYALRAQWAGRPWAQALA